MTITINPDPTATDVTRTSETVSFELNDDNINEVEQFFIVIGEFGDEVSDDSACFARSQGAACQGRKGATRPRITDNDRE